MEDLGGAERLKLRDFVAEVSLWAGRIHLVGKARRAENIRMQLLDSLLLLAAAERAAPEAFEAPGARLADIGSGAGFPGVVWKIARPRIEAVFFERRRKPHIFLERAIALLDLSGARASGEDAAAHPEAGSFGLAVSKAAGRLREMLPLAEMLLAPGGLYVTIKGASWEKELGPAVPGAMNFTGAVELPFDRGHALFFKRRGGG
jgi:16S rRNA (guanine527-N7)-methyltransferase